MAADRFGPFPLEFRLCDACGIPIYVHIFLIAFYVWRLSDEEAAAQRRHGLPDYTKAAHIALTCTLSFVILFVTVLIHELGHCAGAKLVGGRVSRILLWPLGGLAFCSSGGGAKGDLLVALAGPFTHVPQYVAWFALYQLSVRSEKELGNWGPTARGICHSAMNLQILLAVFNLLVPVYPLDCSQVIIAFCRLCGASKRASAFFMVLLSLMCIGVLVASMVGVLHLPFMSMGLSGFNLLMVAWLGFQTYQLYSKISARTEGDHPLLRQFQDEAEPCGARSA
mmetsp:Transcript_58189/g.108953  ORF Transcript_58189/g.108953 Transcript_58189/m.108953 type:complete len:281 (+) Transcript_58189:42-884(+)